MTPELQERFLVGRSPFNGETLVTCDDPCSTDVLEMLQFSVEYLRDKGTDVFRFEDWHEHDGFVCPPAATTWNEIAEKFKSLESWQKAVSEDFHVRIAFFSRNLDWLLRCDIDSEDSESILDAWPYFDFTAVPSSNSYGLIEQIVERWPGYTCVCPARDHFEYSYAG